MPSSLSIVIPAHNESARIASGFERLKGVLDQLGDVEVVVIDDGSSDGTGVVAAETYRAVARARVVRLEQNLGKGAAVRLGLAVATGDVVVVCDADMAIDPAHLPAMVKSLTDSPVAFGTRWNGESIRYDSLVRTAGARLFNALVRHSVATDLRDTQCGFKGFQLGPARLLGNLGLVRGFAFDVELVYLATELRWPIATVPVTWQDVAGSSVRLLRDSRTMLRDIRSLPRNDYACPTVRVSDPVGVEAVRAAVGAVRQSGVVIAEGDDTLISLPRDGALAGASIAQALGGRLSAEGVRAFRDRRLTAV